MLVEMLDTMCLLQEGMIDAGDVTVRPTLPGQSAGTEAVDDRMFP